MERLKDFLFDLSDILLSLVIVAVIFTVVSWKLNETMPMSFALLGDSEDTVSLEPITSAPPVSIVVPESTLAQDTTEDAPAQEETTLAPQPTTAVSTPAKKVTIDIPSGSTGDAIAKILKQSGLINDISAFNKTVESLSLGNKLRAGSFTLSTDMSLETIARRIAGYKN